MRRWMLWLLLGLWGCRALAEGELRIGIEPYFSPKLLLSSMQPLRQALTRSLGRPVILLTAPDYRQFVGHIVDHHYDLVIIGPHTARYAQLEAGYVPLLKGAAQLTALVIVKRHSPIDRLEALQNQPVALPNPLTATAMLGEELLNRQQISARLRYHDFHNAAALAVVRDEARAAIVNNTAFAHMPLELRDQLRVLAESRALPHMVLLVDSRVTPAERQRYSEAVANFLNANEQGRQFLARLGFYGASPIEAGDLSSVEPFMVELKRRLAEGR
ncbi:phosphate/phosphite/phosphonate ABC transporter substrate-binding protein [Chitinimonas lacunae]|uniref:Phosphate/phosphite/phosphonate ABC transporter substrate-binding protein n=1 Tax=Chitinimonas lacunae TaxID=1963018 RepID=A0ABV8MS57_9NEIS